MKLAFAIINIVIFAQWYLWVKEVRSNNQNGSWSMYEAKEGRKVWGVFLFIFTTIHILTYLEN